MANYIYSSTSSNTISWNATNFTSTNDPPNMRKLTIFYHPTLLDAPLVKDGEVEDHILKFWEASEDAPQIMGSSQEIMIDAIRSLVRENKLHYSCIEIGFVTKCTKAGKITQWEKITIDQNGNLDNYPAGFCDTRERFLQKIA